MRVLAINGSPRLGGNTDLLLQAALAAASETGATTHLVQLAGLAIAECDGCQACWAPGDCVKQDDMNALYDQIAASDAILFGTPVYWYGPTGLMKLLLDRLVYFNCPDHRALLRGKRAGLVVPFEENDTAAASGVLEMFRKSLAYLELDFTGAVIVPGVTKLGEVRERAEPMAQARALGAKLVSQP